MSKNAWSPGREQPVGERVRVRIAAVAGDRVDRLDVLRAELEEHLHRRGHDLVLAHARAQHPVDLLVGRVDDSGGVVEQRELVGRLDLPRLEHHRLRVGEVQALALEREQRRRIGHVDPERLLVQARAREARGGSSSRARPGRPSRRASRRASARPTRASSTRAARGSRAGGGAPPSRSPRGSGRPRGRRARSGCSCPAPRSRSRCSSRSGGCSDRRAGARRAPSAASVAFVRSSRAFRRRSKSTRCSQSTAIVAPRDAMFILFPFPER